MANDRWSYQVAEVKPTFLGSTRHAAQERLQQLGLQGWELVCRHPDAPLRARAAVPEEADVMAWMRSRMTRRVDALNLRPCEPYPTS